MMWLDLTAAIVPYAFVLPFLWIAAAYLVAAIRVRHTQSRRQVWSIVVQALWSALYWPVLLIFLSNSARNGEELGWKLLWYVYFIVFPLMVIYGLRPTSKITPLWRKIGFARADDLLLFRPLPEVQPIIDVPDATNSQRWVSRSLVWLMLFVSICAAGVSYLGESLRPCAWLDIATGRSGCLRTLTFDPIPGSVDEIAFSPDGRVMVTSIWNGLMQFYNSADGAVLWELPGQYSRCGQSATFSPDNKWVATIAGDGTVSTRDAQTGELIHSLKAITDTYSIKFSPDGKYLAVNVGRTGLSFWRTADWTLQWIIPISAYSFDFSADGRWLAASTDDKRIGIWKMADATVYRTINADADRVALSSDGTQLAASSLFGSIQVWDVATGQLIRTVPADDRGELAYSPDGQYLVAGEKASSTSLSVYQVSFWRVADGQRAKTLPTHWSPHCMAFAAKSSMFAYGDSQSLKVFRLRQD